MLQQLGLKGIKTASYGEEFTLDQFQALQSIYNYFNEFLFQNTLNNCILNFSRKSKSYGFFAPYRWNQKDDPGKKIHEISLNPEHLKRDPKEVLGTLVHEMVHLWQQDYGKPKNGYHNKEWAQKMKSIGLYPSSTGQEGGKETGKNCSHYIIPGGLYEIYYDLMDKHMLYPLVCIAEGQTAAKKKAKNKIKYTCPGCELNAWGKPNLKIICGECYSQDEEEPEVLYLVGEEPEEED